MKEYFITSDHHFFHNNIIKYTDRPFDNVDEMNERMIEIWNSVVKPGDEVLHLGDLFFNSRGYDKAKEIISRLNGTIDLLKGNHDRFTKKKLHEVGIRNVGNFLIKGKILFSHYYIIQDPKYPHHGVDKTKEYFENNGCEVVFHGHRHSPNPKEWKNHFNVCVDLHEFKPLNLMEVLEQNDWKQYLI